ncbi:MAG: hypothetical protein K9I85_16180 [Saprospiraceae bacterium]|nr:hypothetical protein [Saprospiraceae bacterium]
MKTIPLFFLLWGTSMTALAQVKVDLQAGGANFLGFTINSEYDIPINREKERVMMPRFGVGMNIPQYGTPSAIIHVGLHYRIRKFGLGGEASGFFRNPFVSRRAIHDPPADLMLYPDLNYTITFHNHPHLYLRISAGAYFAFEKTADPFSGKETFKWQGDPIPGAGLNFGYAF